MSNIKEMSREEWSLLIRKSVERELDAEAQRRDINGQYIAGVITKRECHAALDAVETAVQDRINHLLTGGYMNGF